MAIRDRRRRSKYARLWRTKGATADQILGTVYVLHFSQPIGNPNNPRAQAQHYGGFAPGGTLEFDERMQAHACGQGARITRACVERGVGWTAFVVGRRVPLTCEKEMKRKHNLKLFCPICNGSVLIDAPPF